MEKKHNTTLQQSDVIFTISSTSEIQSVMYNVMKESCLGLLSELNRLQNNIPANLSYHLGC